MSPTLTALLWSWNPRPDVLLVLASFGAAYVVGWWRLRALGPDVVPPWRLALYLGGLAAVGLALLSPVDALGSLLFFIVSSSCCVICMAADRRLGRGTRPLARLAPRAGENDVG